MEASPFTVIVTKLHPPVTLSAMVTRQRLLRQFEEAPLRKMTLVQSPAGFGKTTLLAQWRKALPFASGWLSLDKDDVEPVRFLVYLIAALQSTGLISGKEAKHCLDGGGRLVAHDVIGCLINEIVELKNHLVLFLDDYQLVDKPEISTILQDLINFSSSNFHLVLASRTAPSLPVANLRARNIITEFTEADIRFNVEEAAGFIVDQRGVNLSPQEILALHGKTEGWIAGLQLATLSLRDPNHRQNFIKDFSGNIRDVADYLASEVLNQQTEATQSFLLKTSILERVNAEVARALTGCGDSQLVLENLETSNLFLFPLDSTRCWYRYHHLFREFLLSRLRRDCPAELNSLFYSASQWFLEVGLTEEAINYALETDDGEYAATLVEDHALRLIYDGRLPQVERWIRKVPKEISNRRFRLRIFHCWALMHMGMWQQTDTILDETEKRLKAKQLGDKALPAKEAELLNAEIDVLRLANAVVSDNVDRAVILGAKPLPEEQVFSFPAGTQANAMGFLSLARSELSEAVAWGQRALVRHRQSGSVYGQAYAHCLIGLSLLTKGALHAALEQMDRAEQLLVSESRNHSFSAAMVGVLRGAILYEWNQLEKARELLVDSLPLVEECAHLEIRNLAFIVLSRIEQVGGHYSAGLEFQSRALSASRESLIDRTRARLSYERVRLLLDQGKVNDALDEARGLGIHTSDVKPHPNCWEQVSFFHYLIYCRLALAEGKPKSVIALLPSLQTLTRKAAREMMALEVGLILAQAHFQAGDKHEAYACALEVLEASHHEGYLRLFLDEGMGAEALWLSVLSHLEQEPKGGSLPVRDYLRKILHALQKPLREAKQPQATQQTEFHVRGVSGLLEDLSTREMSVLAWMAKGLSNKQIGEQLFVSVNTIRWHVSNILTKFGAQNRTEAVAKAKELGLI